jgi:hypothetical protein
VQARSLAAAAAVASLSAFAAGCGGSSTLSAPAYRAQLVTIGKDAVKAETAAGTAFNAKTIAGIRAPLSAFAAEEDRLGDEVGRLKAPKNASAANAELARGLHDTAAAVRSLLPKLASFKGVIPALAFVQSSSAATKAANEQNAALQKLTKLGYVRR